MEKNKTNKKSSKKTLNSKEKQNNRYIKYLPLILIILILVFFVFKVVKFSFNKIMGNVYEISEIKSNIDNVKIGDTIKYEANGYSDWQVLSVDKENNTLDIISKTSPEEVTLSGNGANETALDVFQETANKYLDGKYAVSARSVNTTDIDNFSSNDFFWLANVNQYVVYYNGGYVSFISTNSEIRYIPVLTLNVDSTSSLAVGNEYSISINGIDAWLIYNIDSSNSITIIPKILPKVMSEDDLHCKDMKEVVDSLIDSYVQGNVTSARSVTISDMNKLNNNSAFNSSTEYQNIYAENFRLYLERTEGNEYLYLVNQYRCDAISYNPWNSQYRRYNSTYSSCNEYAYTFGFRPVVTIKFSDDLVEGKEINTDLKIGDNVKYSSHEYNNWKVLSIDNENKTVDIISGGIVKNIRLSGLDDYNNYETLMQNEVDAYKTGDKVISARLVNISDFENLRNMNDKTIARYYLNNKNEYKTNYRNYYLQETTTYVNIVNYAVAVGYYSELDSEPTSEWEVLYVDSTHASSGLSGAATGPSSYLAGLRPIITLKLDEVEKISTDEVVETQSQESYVQEQTKANANYTKSITKKQIESKLQDIQPNDVKEEQAKENEKEEVEVITKKVIKEDPKAKENYTLFKKYNKKVKGIIINLIILDLIVGFIFYILYKRKNKKTVKF